MTTTLTYFIERDATGRQLHRPVTSEREAGEIATRESTVGGAVMVRIYDAGERVGWALFENGECTDVG